MIASSTTDQLIKEAENAYRSQAYQVAARKFEAAAELYISAENSLMAAEMANNRSVALLKAGDAPGAYQAARDTDTIFAQAGDIRRQAIALSNQASALDSLNKFDRALELYQKAADLLKGLDEREMRPLILKNISYIQFRHANKFGAMATMKMALESQQQLTLRERVLKTLLGIVFRLLGG